MSSEFMTFSAQLEPKATDATELFHDYADPTNTRRAYVSDLKDFLAYLHRRGLRLPVAHEVISAYLADLASSNAYATSTITRRLSAINRAYREAGQTPPGAHPHVQRTMRGIRRKNAHQSHAQQTAGSSLMTPTDPPPKPRATGAGRHPAAPLTGDLLGKIVACMAASGESIRIQRDRALLLLGWSLALRRSELASLCRHDIAFSTQGMTVHLRWSKTDSDGLGYSFFIHKREQPMHCPVAAMSAWLNGHEPSNSAVFRRIHKGGKVGQAPLSDKSVNLIVKHWIKVIGVTDPDRYSAHSLRAGFITTAAQNGVPEWLLQRISRHVSTAVLRRYIRNVDQEVAGVVSSMLDVVSAKPTGA